MKLILKLNKRAFMAGEMFYLGNFTFVLSMERIRCLPVIEVILYVCSLGAKYRKSSTQYFIVSYDNAFKILNNLPMRCSASFMFASAALTKLH